MTTSKKSNQSLQTLLLIALLASGLRLQAQGISVISNGNVGIGNTSPGYLLTVGSSTNSGKAVFQSTDNFHGTIQIGNPTASGEASMSFISGATAFGDNPASAGGNNYMWGVGAGVWGIGGDNFGIGNQGYGGPILTIQSGGNVGIGNASPGYLLSVGSSINSSKAVFEGSDSDHGIIQIGNPTPGGEASLGFISGVTGFGDNPTASIANYFSWVVGAGMFGMGGDSFGIGNDGYGGPIITIQAEGGVVGIGTKTPRYALDVPNGYIHTREVVVDTSGADYVFKPNYKLMPLAQVEQAIKKDQHLPGIPSAQEMSSHGMSVGQLQTKLLAKIEELTLHQIELEKQLKEQAQRIDQLESEKK